MKKALAVFLAMMMFCVIFCVTSSAEAAETVTEAAEVSFFDQIVDFFNRLFGELGSPFRLFIKWISGLI